MDNIPHEVTLKRNCTGTTLRLKFDVSVDGLATFGVGLCWVKAYKICDTSYKGWAIIGIKELCHEG